MKDIKTCFVCKTGIDLEKDSFVEIKEFNQGEFFNKIFCHKNCWREHMSNKGMMRQQMIDANNVLNKIVGKING